MELSRSIASESRSARLRYLWAVALLSAALGFLPSLLLAQSNETKGACSPILQQTTIAGPVTINCPSGRPELQKLAQDLTKLRDQQRLNAEQTQALLNSVNSILPSLVGPLARIEVKQDAILQQLTELLANGITTNTAPAQIRQAVDDGFRRLTATPGEPVAPPTTNKKLAIYKAVASSEHRPEYGAQKAIDGRASTASYLYSWWSRPGDTSGAWIDLHLDRPCIVAELGYYTAFKHVRSQMRLARVVFEDGTTQQVHFEMKEGWQRVSLSPKPSGRVRIQVDDVFPIGKGDQLQILELELYGNSCDK